MRLLVYGAKSIALGACLAIEKLFPTHLVENFLVTSRHGNPSALAGKPVCEIDAFVQKIPSENRSQFYILIATPEDIHSEIIDILETYGFQNYICLDSAKESKLMESYFEALGLFPSIHRIEPGNAQAKARVFSAQFYRDQALQTQYIRPQWITPLQVGALLTDQRVAELTDSEGENISKKNPNYCELTALYWIWKNVLDRTDADYCGVSHYRRFLNLDEADLCRIHEADADVVLPFPTVHEPNILEHHARYLSECDWAAMKSALAELHPEYMQAFSAIFRQPYFYNYNLILAKKQVLEHYCNWLFPILRRVEELSIPKGWERKDRYIGYLGENLATLYFMYHQKRLRIYHTGRTMLT